MKELNSGIDRQQRYESSGCAVGLGAWTSEDDLLFPKRAAEMLRSVVLCKTYNEDLRRSLPDSVYPG